MSKFSKEWEARGSNVLGMLRPQQPLRQKISLAAKRIESQSQMLEAAVNGLIQRDKSLFSKIVDAYSEHDLKRATMYANELVELRKTINLMSNAKLALERIALRLSTITQLGNITAIVAPAIEVLKDVRVSIAGIMPNAENELNAIMGMLDEIMLESGQPLEAGFSFEPTSEEAQKILSEAALVVEERTKEKFPEIVVSKTPEAADERSG
jgi:division protein CdvB (Snf7/Vps24/ESCRT-III family)